MNPPFLFSFAAGRGRLGHLARLMALLFASGAFAQGLVPATMTLDSAPSPDQVILSWATTPGKTYKVHFRDSLAVPWVTNVSPIRASSTVAVRTNSTLDGPLPTRFFWVEEQATAPGNTGSITTTGIVELEKILGLTFSAAQRTQLANTLTGHRAQFEAMRGLQLRNSEPLPLIFNPIPVSGAIEGTQEPITWSPPRRVVVPENRAELAFYSVRDLGELIRTRQLTSMELTRLYLERLKRHDARLHCVITLTEDLALQQAERADAEIGAGNYRGPLHGVPYGIKDLFAVRGYRTTWGAAPFKDQIIDEDATVYRRLEEAGAVLLGKLSTGELAVDDVWFGGQTRNPWNPSQGSGGSSAGPAAATSAGLVAFAIGTETYGSLLAPAMVCRITALRPTFGRVSRSGAMTLCWSLDKVGPMCRFVEDCALVFDVIRGRDLMDPTVVDAPFNYSAAADLTRLRIGYTDGRLSKQTLDRLGAIVGPANLVAVTLPRNPVDIQLVLRSEAAAAFDELVRLGADAFLNTQSVWPLSFRAGQAIPAVEYLQANRLRQRLIQDMDALGTQVDIYVGTEAEVLYGDVNPITNLTGQPCVVIPHGGGTSLGFVGRPFSEATLLALAKAYQDGTAFHALRPPAFAN